MTENVTSGSCLCGTLDNRPGIEPMRNVFCASGAAWYRDASELPRHDELPPK